jgi:hypothetical protein
VETSVTVVKNLIPRFRRTGHRLRSRTDDSQPSPLLTGGTAKRDGMEQPLQFPLEGHWSLLRAPGRAGKQRQQDPRTKTLEQSTAGPPKEKNGGATWCDVHCSSTPGSGPEVDDMASNALSLTHPHTLSLSGCVCLPAQTPLPAGRRTNGVIASISIHMTTVGHNKDEMKRCTHAHTHTYTHVDE